MTKRLELFLPLLPSNVTCKAAAAAAAVTELAVLLRVEGSM
jgi:hypothetical protein